jgi:hypothetical protein
MLQVPRPRSSFFSDAHAVKCVGVLFNALKLGFLNVDFTYRSLTGKVISMKNLHRSRLIVLAAMVLFLSACGGREAPGPVCGDGVCAEDENFETCAADCEPAVELLPTETPEPTPTMEIEPMGYVTFAVYVSDFVNHDHSAETVLALIELFEQSGVHGEFYFNGPMAHIFAEAHGEVIDRLRESGMTVSYHVKAPHPLVPGFQGPITGLPVDETERMITRYENERLDLSTGGLNPEEPGGYVYVGELFGSSPVTVDAPKTSRSGFALPILARLGAQVVVLPGGTDLHQPFREEYSMLVRPADITLNRWEVEGVDGIRPWWDMLGSEFAADFRPRDRLQDQAEAWGADRLPILLVPINEYSFYASGSAPWTLIYYQDTERSSAKTPPFDLNAADPSTMRTEAERELIWDAYAEMVEWGSIYLEPLTSAELLLLAAGIE